MVEKIYIGKETFKGVIVSPSVTDRSTHKGIIYNGSNKSFLLLFFLLHILNVCKILSTAKGVLDINFGICLKFYTMFMVIGCKKVKALLCKFWNYYRNWGWVGYFIESNLPMVKWLVDRLWFIILRLILYVYQIFYTEVCNIRIRDSVMYAPAAVRYNYLPIFIHSLVSKYIHSM